MQPTPFIDPAAAATNRARFEPKVHSCAWVTEREQPFDAFAEEAAERCGLSLEQWGRMLWHGGLHIAKRRVDAAALPTSVQPGVRAVVYWFEREPELVPLAADAILLEGEGV